MFDREMLISKSIGEIIVTWKHIDALMLNSRMKLILIITLPIFLLQIFGK